MNRRLILCIALGLCLNMAGTAISVDLNVPDDYATIQAAIHAAEDGDVIYVDDGIYNENLTIDGVDVSLIASGDATIAGVVNTTNTISIYNSTCTIDGFTVLNGKSGIYARGVSSYGDGPVDVSFINNYVTDYYKNGITVNGELAKGFVKDNVIVSEDDPVVAQNGIQFGYGAKGQVLRNLVDTNWYLGASWTASGILIFESDNVSIKLNNVINAQTGIGIETWGYLSVDSASKNEVVKNKVTGSMWGITVSAYSWAYSEMDCFLNNNKVTNNTIVSDNGDIGIYVGAVYVSGAYTPEADNNKVINNKIKGFDYDVVDDGSAATKIHANKPLL